jgi:XapX domain-containing protein
MAPYILSTALGLGVGVAYGLFGVRSPAPPVIALLGLLGMLVGEQAVSWWRGHVDLAQAAARICTHGTHEAKPEGKQDI